MSANRAQRSRVGVPQLANASGTHEDRDDDARLDDVRETIDQPP